MCVFFAWLSADQGHLFVVCVRNEVKQIFFFVGMVCTFCFDFAVYIHLLDIEAGLILHLKKARTTTRENPVNRF